MGLKMMLELVLVERPPGLSLVDCERDWVRQAHFLIAGYWWKRACANLTIEHGEGLLGTAAALMLNEA